MALTKTQIRRIFEEKARGPFSHEPLSEQALGLGPDGDKIRLIEIEGAKLCGILGVKTGRADKRLPFGKIEKALGGFSGGLLRRLSYEAPHHYVALDYDRLMKVRGAK